MFEKHFTKRSIVYVDFVYEVAILYSFMKNGYFGEWRLDSCLQAKIKKVFFSPYETLGEGHSYYSRIENK